MAAVIGRTICSTPVPVPTLVPISVCFREWDLLDHCDRPLHTTQQDHEGGSETHLFGELQIELQELIVGLSVKDIYTVQHR